MYTNKYRKVGGYHDGEYFFMCTGIIAVWYVRFLKIVVGDHFCGH